MEIPGQGCGTGNGQDPELSEHFPERWGARCALGQEMASPGHDVGTSFLTSLGDLCQARGAGLKWGQILPEGVLGGGLPLAGTREYFSRRECSRPAGQVSAGAVTHLVGLRGTGRAVQACRNPEAAYLH